MLGTFMEEMQITPDQFEMACLEGRQNTAAGSAFSFHQGLFQQVIASMIGYGMEFTLCFLLDLGSQWYSNICENDDTKKCGIAVTSSRLDRTTSQFIDTKRRGRHRREACCQWCYPRRISVMLNATAFLKPCRFSNYFL